eukprot:7829219-Heterocapsa_arctica.AAC.1
MRFFVETEGKKARKCDDAKRSGVNSTAGLTERIRVPGFSGALVLIHALMIWFPKVPLLMATEDFDGAFTQLPLHPDQQKYSYCHVLDPSGNV